jgi:hypothetical protein
MAYPLFTLFNKKSGQAIALTRYTSIPAKKAALTIELSDKAFMPPLYSTRFGRILNEDTDFLVTNVTMLIDKQRSLLPHHAPDSIAFQIPANTTRQSRHYPK